MLNGKPRDWNLAKEDLGDARETRHGNCNPIRPARVMEQSFTSSKLGLSIFCAFANFAQEEKFQAVCFFSTSKVWNENLQNEAKNNPLSSFPAYLYGRSDQESIKISDKKYPSLVYENFHRIVKYSSPWVLTIYTEKPEIPVGKSNGSRHSVWKASEIMGCRLGWCMLSILLSLFSWSIWLHFVTSPSSVKSS